MLNRYSITNSAAELESNYRVEAPASYKPRYNAAPSQLLPVITAGAERGISWFFWGVPPERSRNKPVSEKFLFRKAAELASRPALKTLLLHHRCEIPADGFYVWKHVGRKTLVPHRVTLTSRRPFSIAGIWEEFESETGEMQHTFSMVSVPSPDSLSSLTDSVPLLLDEKGQSIWMTWHAAEKDLIQLLTNPVYEPMAFHPVSPAIEDTRLDLPALMENTPPSDQFGNLTLFG